MQARTFWTWLREIDRGIFRNRNHRKDLLRYQILRPFWAKGPKTVDRREERQQSRLFFSLSLSIQFLARSSSQPKLFPRANQLLVKLRESKAVELSLVSLIETEDRYIQFQCFCLICQHTGASCSWWPRHSRSPLMREHTREKQRQR